MDISGMLCCLSNKFISCTCCKLLSMSVIKKNEREKIHSFE